MSTATLHRIYPRPMSRERIAEEADAYFARRGNWKEQMRLSAMCAELERIIEWECHPHSMGFEIDAAEYPL